MINNSIDNGKSFDFGKTSLDYAKYRDIYPKEFYEKIYNFGLCTENQKVLDLGTGTGVIPRNMYQYGAEFVGVDISQNQITQAKELSKGMNISYLCQPVETLEYSQSFDIVTACQCFFYFNHNVLAPKIFDMLKSNGKLAIIYMAWLPYEDKIAKATEDLILKYNPVWSGCGETRHNIYIPEVYNKYFDTDTTLLYDLKIPFTIDTWNGRIKTCRGIGASLSNEEISNFEIEHLEMLRENASNSFNILHYVAITILKKKG